MCINMGLDRVIHASRVTEAEVLYGLEPVEEDKSQR